MWTVNILTLFPQIYPGALQYSVTGKSLDKLWALNAYDLREFACKKSVDDTVYGGGSGMLLRPDVLGQAIEKLFLPNGYDIIYLTPQGKLFKQQTATELTEGKKGINIICGRFEGIDERVLKEYNIFKISIGDYILSCGDVAAFSIIDACVRMLPGVLKQSDSLLEESFGNDHNYLDLLEYPHYTRPCEWKGHKVPEILLSGNHGEISNWRLQEAEKRTKMLRPDLWDQHIKRST